jgi:hypothetical protein
MTSSSFNSSFTAVPSDTTAPFLFVYGSHMSPQVLSKLLGRVPMMISDATLDDYGRFAVFRKTLPGIIPRVGSHVKGVLLPDLTAEELEILDMFEGDGFERQCVSGRILKRNSTWKWKIGILISTVIIICSRFLSILSSHTGNKWMRKSIS